MKLVARLAIVAAAAALTAGALATSANATTATLQFQYSGCTNSYGQHFDYTMRVHGESGWWPPTRIEVRLWGDDSSYDDLLVGPFSRWYDWWGNDTYSIDFCVNQSTLDEDWDGRDELYAGVRFYDLETGHLKALVESNRLYGHF
jgi:hypothetical protein